MTSTKLDAGKLRIGRGGYFLQFFFEASLIFGGVLCLFTGLGTVLRPRLSFHTLFIVILSCSVSVLYLYLFFLVKKIEFMPGFWNHMYIPFVYTLGPGMYCLFMCTIREDYVFQYNTLTFLPSLIIAIAFPTLGMLFPYLFESLPVDYFSRRATGMPDCVLIAGFFINGFYYAAVFLRSLRIFSFAALKNERGARILLAILLGSGGITSFIILAYITRSLPLLFSTAFALTLFVCFGYLTGQRFPALFQQAGPSVREAYRNSRLLSLDLKDLELRLNRLMGQDKIYRQEDLTLIRLAEALEISAHQLSEFLNNKRQMNFSKFVNSYRVEEAAQILLRENQANILSVAYQVGFNSRANFNLAFKQFMNVAPRDFIRKNRSAGL